MAKCVLVAVHREFRQTGQGRFAVPVANEAMFSLVESDLAKQALEFDPMPRLWSFVYMRDGEPIWACTLNDAGKAGVPSYERSLRAT